MKYRKLGRTGFQVSEMAHGLWGMSGWSGSDDQESLAALQLATDTGLQLLRHRLGLRRGQERRPAGRNSVAEPREALVRGFENPADESQVAGAIRSISIRMFFPPTMFSSMPT